MQWRVLLGKAGLGGVRVYEGGVGGGGGCFCCEGGVMGLGGLMRFPSMSTQFPELEVLSENCRSLEKP